MIKLMTLSLCILSIGCQEQTSALRSVGGKELASEAYPTVAIWGPSSSDNILYGARWEQSCSGILISSRHVLTAAHCFTYAAQSEPWPSDRASQYRIDTGAIHLSSIVTSLPSHLHQISNHLVQDWEDRKSWLEATHPIHQRFHQLLGKLDSPDLASSSYTNWELAHLASAMAAITLPRITQIDFHPDYRGPVRSPDLAIVTLDTEIRKTFAVLSGLTDKIELLHVAGFGIGPNDPRSDNQYLPRILRGGRLPNAALQELRSTDSKSAMLSLTHQSGVPHLCPGDSGSGILSFPTSTAYAEETPRTMLVLAILSDTTSDDLCEGRTLSSGTSTWTRLDTPDTRKWIHHVTGL